MTVGVDPAMLWRLAAAITARWYAAGRLCDRSFAMLRAAEPVGAIAIGRAPTTPLLCVA